MKTMADLLNQWSACRAPEVRAIEESITQALETTGPILFEGHVWIGDGKKTMTFPAERVPGLCRVARQAHLEPIPDHIPRPPDTIHACPTDSQAAMDDWVKRNVAATGIALALEDAIAEDNAARVAELSAALASLEQAEAAPPEPEPEPPADYLKVDPYDREIAMAAAFARRQDEIAAMLGIPPHLVRGEPKPADPEPPAESWRDRALRDPLL
jgi:hypothetical protein